MIRIFTLQHARSQETIPSEEAEVSEGLQSHGRRTKSYANDDTEELTSSSGFSAPGKHREAEQANPADVSGRAA
jgi:hypothetical protein